MFSICCICGVWQLHRYHFKQELLSTYEKRLNSVPKSLIQMNNKDDMQLQFQPLAMHGHYIYRLTMLVQNKVHNDKMGFEVITPLRVPGETKLLLIDRGWVPAVNGKVDALALSSAESDQHVAGYIKLLNERQFTLGKNILSPNATPIVMQKIDVDEISRITNETFYPFVLRLNPSEPNGFVREWVIANVPPQRHFGYAIQWFVMALVLLIAYFSFCCERVGRHAESK